MMGSGVLPASFVFHLNIYVLRLLRHSYNSLSHHPITPSPPHPLP